MEWEGEERALVTWLLKSKAHLGYEMQIRKSRDVHFASGSQSFEMGKDF